MRSIISMRTTLKGLCTTPWAAPPAGKTALLPTFEGFLRMFSVSVYFSCLWVTIRKKIQSYSLSLFSHFITFLDIGEQSAVRQVWIDFKSPKRFHCTDCVCVCACVKIIWFIACFSYFALMATVYFCGCSYVWLSLGMSQTILHSLVPPRSCA